MKTRCVIKAISVVVSLFGIVGCGEAPEPVYDEELKDYGQPGESEATPAIGQPTIGQPTIGTGNGGPAPLPMPGPGSDDGGDTDLSDSSDDDAGDDDAGEDDSDADGSDSSAEDDGDEGDDDSDGADDSDGGSGEDDGDDSDGADDGGDGGLDGIIIGDDGEDDGGDDIEEPPPIPPETLISSNWYRAFFDVDSAQGVRDGSGYRSLGQIENQVKDKLTNEPSDGVVISQTFGDGVSTSLNSQDIYNSAGDTNRDEGAPTVSGVQYMDRVVTPECPGVFLCISRMWFEPVEGDTVTYCYEDPDTGEPALYPYGPMPNYKERDFEPYYGEYGPYRVTKYAGKVECSDPGYAILSEDILVTIAAIDVTDTAYDLHIYEQLDAQFGVSFGNARVEDDLDSPYIDETIQLNTISKYVLNEDVGEIVKMVVTSRQSIDVAAEAGGGAFGRFIANLLNIQGIIVDLHFELCNNLLDDDSAPHCEAPFEPVTE